MRSVCLVLFVALACACSMIKKPSEQKRDTAFQSAVETYRKLVRWGYFEQAAQYLKGKDAALPPPNLAAYDQYKVTGYSVGEQIINNTGDEARIIAQIEYYDIDTHVVGAVRDEQYWWYDTLLQRWFLGTPMPVLGPGIKRVERPKPP